MITVKIIKPGYGHKPGQVMELSEFDAGHLMAFHYAVPYVEPPVAAVVEPPENRITAYIKKRGRPRNG